MRKSNIKDILLGLYSLIFVMLVIQIGFELYYETHFNIEKFSEPSEELYLTEHLVPYVNLTSHEDIITINSYGFREYEYPLEKPEDTVRIAILGDSFTFGQGIENLDDTYPKVLEKLLNGNNGEKYQVLNFGMQGANSLDVLWILKNKVVDFNPDVVLYGMFLDDLLFTKENLDVSFCKLFEKEKNLYLGDFIHFRLNWLTYNLDDFYSESFDFTDVMSDSNYYGYRCFDNIMNEVSQLSEDHDFEFIVFNIPDEIEKNDLELFFRNNTNTIVEEHNLKTFPLFIEQFWENAENLTNKDLRVNAEIGEYHYNERGNRIIAEILYESLKE